MFRSLLVLSLLCLCTYSLDSADAANNSSEALDLSASDSLEWYRDQGRFVAIGDVVATQGTAKITCDTMNAEYNETKSSGFDLTVVVAKGNVKITNEGIVATGDLATYALKENKITITGNTPEIDSEDLNVKAQGGFIYMTEEGKLTGTGGVVAKHMGDTLTSDQITAIFAQNAAGKRELKKIIAEGNVVLTTAQETLTGDHGVYNAETKIANITGNVTIKRGNSFLSGDRGQVNLETNISRLFGNKKSDDGRVHGTFYPSENKKSQ